MDDYNFKQRLNGFQLPAAWYPLKFAPKNGKMIVLKNPAWGGYYPVVAWGNVDPGETEGEAKGWIFCEAILTDRQPLGGLDIEDLALSLDPNNSPEKTTWGFVTGLEDVLTSTDHEAANDKRRNPHRNKSPYRRR